MRVVWSIGANLGSRLASLNTAVAGLAGAYRLLAVSPVYETAPVGGIAQPDYLNAVVVTGAPDDLALTDLLDTAGRLESAAGRRRGQRWGPRTLDVDVVSVERLGTAVLSSDPRLTLPHPRAHERAFVLAPWADVEPSARLPGHGPVVDVLARVSGRGGAAVNLRPDLVLAPPA